MTNEDADEITTQTMKEYQIMLKVARAHMKKCPNFEREVLREFEINE